MKFLNNGRIYIFGKRKLSRTQRLQPNLDSASRVEIKLLNMYIYTYFWKGAAEQNSKTIKTN